MYRIKLAAAVLSTVLSSSVLAQTTTRTYHFTTVPNQTAVNELGTIIRTIDVQTVTCNDSTVTVSGTPDEIALATWLVQQLDTTNRPIEVPSYTVMNGSGRHGAHLLRFKFSLASAA